jgi:hypothetical protein
MIMPITKLTQLNFLIEYSHQIQFDQKLKLTMTNKTQAFLKDSLTIELDNLSTLILTKTSHSGSIKFFR